MNGNRGLEVSSWDDGPVAGYRGFGGGHVLSSGGSFGCPYCQVALSHHPGLTPKIWRLPGGLAVRD